VIEPEQTLDCIECGGTVHLLTRPPGPDDLPWAAGDVVVYRCADCMDRFDMVLGDVDGNDDRA
jgi:hypothetical protein